VTYIGTGKRWTYLAIVMDLFSRKPGWSLSLSPNSQLAADALKMAFESRGKPKGALGLPQVRAVFEYKATTSV